MAGVRRGWMGKDEGYEGEEIMLFVGFGLNYAYCLTILLAEDAPDISDISSELRAKLLIRKNSKGMISKSHDTQV